MSTTTSKVSQLLAKILGIQLQGPNQAQEEIARGESVFSVQTAQTFVEEPPTTAEWLRGLIPTNQSVLSYLKALLPFLSWIHHYNLQWFLGDLIAGKIP